MDKIKTFILPEYVENSKHDRNLANELIVSWQTNGILQIAMSDEQAYAFQHAITTSKQFCQLPLKQKKRFVSASTYSGYIASGEETTADEQDLSEVFTVCKDLPVNDERVMNNWPCHGPTPWPNEEYKQSMQAYTKHLGKVGEKLLQLIALGLGLSSLDTLTQLTADGWHHMRVLKFPSKTKAQGKGIGAHTDYGLLIIAAQDDVGGLYIRPHVEGEKRFRNWLENESMAGIYENASPWTFVKPVPDVFTVFPGDMLQLLTDGYLLSTPHKVKLADRERFTLAYFHEPNFNSWIKPINRESSPDEWVHYGTHFTNMFMRSYQDRITTQHIKNDGGLSVLNSLREQSLQDVRP